MLLVISDLYHDKSRLSIKRQIDERKQGKVFISGFRTQEVLPQMIHESLQVIMKQRIKEYV